MRRAAILVLAFTPLAALADEASVVARIMQSQQALTDYRVDMRISVFGGASEAPTLEIPARSTRSGAAIVQEFQGYLILIRPEMRVVVDRAGRTIYLNAVQADQPVVPFVDPANALEQARAAGYELHAAVAPGGPSLQVTAPGRPSYRLEFGPDLKLARMEMDAPEGAAEVSRTTVTYSWSEAPRDDSRLSTDYYVRRAAGGWEPAENFAGYRIVVSREP